MCKIDVTYVEVSGISRQRKVFTKSQSSVIEISSHVVGDRDDEGTYVIESALMAITAAIVKKVEFDHMAVIAVGGEIVVDNNVRVSIHEPNSRMWQHNYRTWYLLVDTGRRHDRNRSKAVTLKVKLVVVVVAADLFLVGIFVILGSIVVVIRRGVGSRICIVGRRGIITSAVIIVVTGRNPNYSCISWSGGAESEENQRLH